MPVIIPKPEVDWSEVAAVYTDGGVIGKNPSPVGGTWAFVLADAGGRPLYEDAGWCTPAEVGLPAVSNNVTELLAALVVLEHAPPEHDLEWYTDSGVTLARFVRAERSKYDGVPEHLVARWLSICRGWVTPALLGGHPTRDELAAGRRRDGKPVSAHNVRCDDLCRAAAGAFREPLPATEAR